MLDLKFFYIVELNLQHRAIQRLPLAQEFAGQSWLTLTSEPFTDDKKCIDECKAFMKAKTKFFNEEQKVVFSYAENPLLNCPEDQLDTIDIGDFDENALVSMTITDIDDDWLMRAAIMVFGVDAPQYNRRLH